MPSSNGVYTLPNGYLAVTGQPILASQHNPPLEDIAAALTLRLSRDGTAPMTGALKLADGAVALPGLSFQSDPSTGFYKTVGGFAATVGGVKIAEFLSGGVSGVRVVGEIVPYVGTAVPSSLWVFPVGQTLSRIANAELWAFAQTEIANGNSFFNNGDGSTTFGIGDLRGRVFAALDAMGGSAAGRLTSTTMTPDGNTIGATGGAQTKTLLTANLPPYTPSGSVTTTIGGGAHYFTTPGNNVGVGGANTGGQDNYLRAINPSQVSAAMHKGARARRSARSRRPCCAITSCMREAANVISNQNIRIPPDHFLAQKIYDAVTLQFRLIDECNKAHWAGDAARVKIIVADLATVGDEIKKMQNEYRIERGADETCTVSLTYDRNGYPVVNGRPGGPPTTLN